jgi:hypothetical protein
MMRGLAMRIALSIDLNEAMRGNLERLSRECSTAARKVLRSRIVLLAKEGMQNKQIAAELGVSISNDLDLAAKLEAVVGLYLIPPERALVLSADEKSQTGVEMQA